MINQIQIHIDRNENKLYINNLEYSYLLYPVIKRLQIGDIFKWQGMSFVIVHSEENLSTYSITGSERCETLKIHELSHYLCYEEGEEKLKLLQEAIRNMKAK